MKLAHTQTLPKKNQAKPEKQKGKKEGCLGEGIFARLLCLPKADWGGSVSAPLLIRGRQNAGRDSIQIRKRIFFEKSSDFVQS